MEKPRLYGAFFFLSIQYSGWSITHTPRECDGLALVLVIWGLEFTGNFPN